MAKLPGEIKATILNLLGQLAELIDEAGETEFVIFEQFGETEITISGLNELQNVRERLRNSYTRLCRLFLQVSESQPTAPAAVLNLLYLSIEEGQANLDAGEASIREAKRELGLL